MKTVIEMAREAGVFETRYNPVAYSATPEALERFAALVMANHPPQSYMTWQEGYEAGKQAEREACHALRQTLPNPYDHCQVSAHAHDMAIVAYGAAIRARGETK